MKWIEVNIKCTPEIPKDEYLTKIVRAILNECRSKFESWHFLWEGKPWPNTLMLRFVGDDEKIDDKIEQILASHQAGETTNTLVNLGRFLSAPIDRSTLQPLDSNQSLPEVESGANLALNVLMLILRALSFR